MLFVIFLLFGISPGILWAIFIEDIFHPIKIAINSQRLYYMKRNGKKGFIEFENINGIYEDNLRNNPDLCIFYVHHSQIKGKGNFKIKDKRPINPLYLNYQNGMELKKIGGKWLKIVEEKNKNYRDLKYEKRNSEKILFSSWSVKTKKTVKFIFISLIIFTIFGNSIFICAWYFIEQNLIYFIGLVLYNFGMIANYFTNLWKRELHINNDGITITKGIIWKKFIPFSEIFYINLNSKEKEYVGYFEIVLLNDKIIKFYKGEIEDWKEFYSVMLCEINDNVKVVE